MLNKELPTWAELLHNGNNECNENFLKQFNKENEKAS
jgi:hypothetical protein